MSMFVRCALALLLCMTFFDSGEIIAVDARLLLKKSQMINKFTMNPFAYKKHTDETEGKEEAEDKQTSDDGPAGQRSEDGPAGQRSEDGKDVAVQDGKDVAVRDGKAVAVRVLSALLLLSVSINFAFFIYLFYPDLINNHTGSNSSITDTHADATHGATPSSTSSATLYWSCVLPFILAIPDSWVWKNGGQLNAILRFFTRKTIIEDGVDRLMPKKETKKETSDVEKLLEEQTKKLNHVLFLLNADAPATSGPSKPLVQSKAEKKAPLTVERKETESDEVAVLKSDVPGASGMPDPAVQMLETTMAGHNVGSLLQQLQSGSSSADSGQREEGTPTNILRRRLRGESPPTKGAGSNFSLGEIVVHQQPQ